MAMSRESLVLLPAVTPIHPGSNGSGDGDSGINGGSFSGELSVWPSPVDYCLVDTSSLYMGSALVSHVERLLLVQCGLLMHVLCQPYQAAEQRPSWKDPQFRIDSTDGLRP